MLRGSCLCGGVKYEISGELSGALNCHCSMCRKAHGAAFRSRASVNASDFKWVQGEELVTYFESSPGTNLIDWSRSCDVALYFANQDRQGAGAIFVCDATSTGKTLQTVPVAEILAKVRMQVMQGLPNGSPLLFSPKAQIAYQRAKNQQAVYFAQMDLRLDLMEHWRLQGKANSGETIAVKLVLPPGSEQDCDAYLGSRGVKETLNKV